MGHYSNLYSRKTVVTDEALSSIEDLLVIDKADAQPTTEELKKALDTLSSGKVPGSDCIPPEVIKCGKPVLLETLDELLIVSAGKRVLSPKTCATQLLSPYTRARVVAVIATTAEAFHCWALLETFLSAFCSQDYRYLHPVYILSPSVVSGPANLSLTRFSLSSGSRKNAGNRGSHFTLTSLTWPRPLTLSQKKPLPHLGSLLPRGHKGHVGWILLRSLSHQKQREAGLRFGFDALWNLLFTPPVSRLQVVIWQRVPTQTNWWKTVQHCTPLRKGKVSEIVVRDMLFLDDAALVPHTEEPLHYLLTALLSHAKTLTSPSVSKTPTPAYKICQPGSLHPYWRPHPGGGEWVHLS